jgi:hypothetical protein
VPAKGQLRLDAVLQGGKARLLQPRHLARQQRGGRRHPSERGAAPQPQRLAEQLNGPNRVPGGHRLAGRTGQPLERLQVDLLGLHHQRVPG